MAYLTGKGKRVIWDLCDPVWWWMPKEKFLFHVKQCSDVVVSTEGLKKDLGLLGVDSTVILDRLPYREGHREASRESIPIVIWFGHSHNRLPSLIGMHILWGRLHENKFPFRMRILDDLPEMDQTFQHLPYKGQFNFQRFNWETEHQDLMEADIALLPPYPEPWGRMKQPTKWMTAAWAGLPITDGKSFDECRIFLSDEEARRKAGTNNRKIAERNFEINRSAAEWRKLLQWDYSNVKASIRSTADFCLGFSEPPLKSHFHPCA